jgi:hypothetical protein
MNAVPGEREQCSTLCTGYRVLGTLYLYRLFVSQYRWERPRDASQFHITACGPSIDDCVSTVAVDPSTVPTNINPVLNETSFNLFGLQYRWERPRDASQLHVTVFSSQQIWEHDSTQNPHCGASSGMLIFLLNGQEPLHGLNEHHRSSTKFNSVFLDYSSDESVQGTSQNCTLLYSAHSKFESMIASQNPHHGASSHRTAHFLTERVFHGSNGTLTADPSVRLLF